MDSIGSLDAWGQLDTQAGLAAALGSLRAARSDPAHTRHAEAAAIGIVVVPPTPPTTFRLPPLGREDGFSLLDLRDGNAYLHTVPVETGPTDSGNQPVGVTAIVAESREHQPVSNPGSSASIVFHRVLHGGSSTICKLVRPVDRDDGRWYPEAFEGISPGQILNLAGPIKDLPQNVTVAALGFDTQLGLPYFTVTQPVEPEVPREVFISRKTALHGASIVSEDHTPNQGSALTVQKFAYGDGDAFGINTSLYYQGDLFSAGGDEGAVGNTVELVQDLQVFTGTVQSLDRPSGELICVDHLNIERLATGRPLVNLTEDQRRIRTTARVFVGELYPGSKELQLEHGVVHVVDGGLPREVIGRFLAVDEPSEYIDPSDPRLANLSYRPTTRIHRWYQITSLREDPATGNQLLLVRFKRWLAYDGAPDLVDGDNLYYNYSQRTVRIIIAPGAVPYDIRDGFAESENDVWPKRILLQPNADLVGENPELPFKPGDRIIQALGPRCWNPSGMRVRHFSWFPSPHNSADASFVAVNDGNAVVQAGLKIDGAPTTAAARTRYGLGTAFNAGIVIQASTDTAISVTGEVRTPVPNGRAFAGLPAPDAGVALYLSQAGGPDARKVIAWSTDRADELVTAGYDPATGTFRIAGARRISFVGAQTVEMNGAAVTGISTVTSFAGTARLRSAMIPVPAGAAWAVKGIAAAARVALPDGAPDPYVVSVVPNWLTTVAVAKEAGGFTVLFGSLPPQEPGLVPPAGPDLRWTFDWVLTRPS